MKASEVRLYAIRVAFREFWPATPGEIQIILASVSKRRDKMGRTPLAKLEHPAGGVDKSLILNNSV